ncbi:hypothetical protein ACCO45_014018 [Purpureocillium lilacinum]|uniref:Uncharacterized protein n=1 Tax=Purpureocillium lilacinum TaxID=33203 RepID=A0ACC4D9Y0_PURLI
MHFFAKAAPPDANPAAGHAAGPLRTHLQRPRCGRSPPPPRRQGRAPPARAGCCRVATSWTDPVAGRRPALAARKRPLSPAARRTYCRMDHVAPWNRRASGLQARERRFGGSSGLALARYRCLGCWGSAEVRLDEAGPFQVANGSRRPAATTRR